MNYVMLFLLLGAMAGCGKNGKDGAPGSQGPQGVPGHACEVVQIAPGGLAPNGGAQIICANSSALVLNGSNGQNGTLLTSIKLCPGTTVYPSKFIEEAFCLDNKLIAVYSANGGFLTEIPPGTYGSNGINASCNFTVLANCGIQN